MKHLISANARLKGVKYRLRIEIKDQGRGTLNLRGQLPPKDGQGQWTRQRIYLGLPANPSGVAQAEKMARKISADLDVGQFSWDDYLTPTNEGQELSKALERYHKHYLDQGKSEKTWKTDHWIILKHLTGKIDPQALKQLVLDTKPNTKTRKRACMAVTAFAKFLAIPLDVKDLQGNYSSNRVS